MSCVQAMIQNLRTELSADTVDLEVARAEIARLLEMLDQRLQAKPRNPATATSRSLALMPDLSKELLHRVWPACRVHLGRGVCRSVRAALQDTPRAEFTIRHKAQRLLDVADSPDEEIASYLLRFPSTAVTLHVGEASTKQQTADLALKALKVAVDRGWSNLRGLNMERFGIGMYGNALCTEAIFLCEAQRSILAKCKSLCMLNLKGFDLRGQKTALCKLLKSCPGLRELDLGSNGEELDLAEICKACTALTALRISANVEPHSQKSKHKNLGISLQCCTAMRELRLSQDFKGDVAPELASALRSLTNLTILDLKNNFALAAVRPMNQLLQSLEALTALTELDLSTCDIFGEKMSCLAVSLGSLPELATLRLQRRAFSPSKRQVGPDVASRRGFEALAQAVQGMPKLTHIDIEGLGGEKHCSVLTDAIAALGTSKLRVARTSTEGQAPDWNPLALDDDFEVIRKHVGREGAGADTLRLECGGDGEERIFTAAASLGEAAPRLTSLTALHLERYILSAQTAASVGEAVQQLPALQTLGVVTCRLTAELLTATVGLAAAIASRPKLTALSLDKNRLGLEGLRLLAEALRGNSTLSTLGLRKNGIEHEPRALGLLMRRAQGLTSLDLGLNPLTSCMDGVEAMLALLGTFPRLKFLGMCEQEFEYKEDEHAEEEDHDDDDGDDGPAGPLVQEVAREREFFKARTDRLQKILEAVAGMAGPHACQIDAGCNDNACYDDDDLDEEEFSEHEVPEGLFDEDDEDDSGEDEEDQDGEDDEGDEEEDAEEDDE